MRPIIDYLIVVPLDEEYAYVREIVEKYNLNHARTKPITIGSYVYSKTVLETKNGSVSTVMLSVGRMTEAPFRAAVETSIRLWRPAATILIGIAGSLDSKNLALGDIIVPRKVLGYTEAKAEAADGDAHAPGSYSMVYRPTGHDVDCELAAQARALKLGYLRKWQRACLTSVRRDKVLSDRYRSTTDGLRYPEIHNHDNDVIASGNVVVASKAFADELKRSFGDAGRMIKAVEMEAKGFCEAMGYVKPKPQSLIVRGISDHADEKKASLEAESKDRWRRFAAQNAARFAKAFIVSRPTIEEDYRPIALPQLRLEPDGESARLCMEERIDAREAGMRNLAFRPFLTCDAGRPRVELNVRAYDGEGRPVPIREVVLRQVKGPELARQRNIETFTYSLERSAEPPALDLFVGLEDKTRRLVASSKDEFERSSDKSLRF